MYSIGCPGPFLKTMWVWVICLTLGLAIVTHRQLRPTHLHWLLGWSTISLTDSLVQQLLPEQSLFLLAKKKRIGSEMCI